MRYLVTGVQDGKQFAFYTDWFDVENNFNSDLQMVVFDLINYKYICNSLRWTDIEFDHL